MKNFTRTVWVGYSATNGFMKGRTYPDWTDDFSKARMYGRKQDVMSSAARVQKRLPDHGKVNPIPIELNLEEEVALILKLGGIPDHE